jgi:hypothetical protein
MGFYKYVFNGYQGRNIQLKGPLLRYLRTGNFITLPGQPSAPLDNVGAIYLWVGQAGDTGTYTGPGLYYPPFPNNPGDYTGFLSRYATPANPGIAILAQGNSGTQFVDNWIASYSVFGVTIFPDPWDYNANPL